MISVHAKIVTIIATRGQAVPLRGARVNYPNLPEFNPSAFPLAAEVLEYGPFCGRRASDFPPIEAGKVAVSTMHVGKGSEFSGGRLMI